MKKTLLSTAALSTLVMGAGDIETPHERIMQQKNTTTPVMEKSFLDRFHFKSDLRLRYESIERDDKDNKYRTRYRLRLGLHVDLMEHLMFDVGMRSGFGNPTSGNQTIYTDRPLSDYFWQSLRFNILGLTYNKDHSTLNIGRQPYLMYRPIKSQLVWDNDVSLNGVNYQYKDESRIVTLGVNQPSLEEKAEDSAKTINLYLAQYVHKTKLDNAKLVLGTGIYYYTGLKGSVPLFGKNKGNTLVNGVYANDYHIGEGFAELQFKEVLGKPFKMAASIAYNFAASDNNFGYDLAFQIGKAKEIGDWQVKYSYTDLQEDAVFGAYSDSDNFGGGTAARGHAIRAKYKVGKKLYFAGNFFFDTLYASKSKTGEEANYDRVQLDVIVKF